jgi:YHS domain-containing protein
MVRVVLYLFLALILITFLRAVVGVVSKALSGLIEPGPAQRSGSSGEPIKAGELKRDPVCGTYVSTASSVKRTIDGQTVHFCSTACSEKYHAKA